MDRGYAWVFACLLILSTLPAVAADRGMVAPGGISVYEPGQKAIIAWNGGREVLILSTDVRASGNSWVLELLPLPAQPTIEAGDFESFDVIEELLWKYASDVRTKRGAMSAEAPLEVIFQENIGAHFITVARAASAQELIGFAENLWAEHRSQDLPLGGLENPVSRYIERGVEYWAFDLIDLSDIQKSIQPIVYTFETNYLYFPLEISSLASGETKITLFTLTSSKLDANEVEDAGFSIAPFTAGEENVLIEFKVSENELQRISSKVSELFEGGAWLTALTYQGPLEDLKGDLTLSVGTNQSLAAAWAVLILGALLAIFAIFYRLSPYYKIERSS